MIMGFNFVTAVPRSQEYYVRPLQKKRFCHMRRPILGYTWVAECSWICAVHASGKQLCHIHLPVCLWIKDPHSRAPKKNTSHGNEVPPQDTTHLIQRPCYQRGSPCPRSSRAIGPHEDLTTVKRHKLQWYVHVSRSSGLARTILQGTVKGGRKQGRQRKRWEDNIREWTGLEFAKSQRAVENEEKWRKLVAKSFVVPQRPSQLMDIWGDVNDSLGQKYSL